ncbi:hypothetical protein D3C87_1963040 [compost metagenome]
MRADWAALDRGFSALAGTGFSKGWVVDVTRRTAAIQGGGIECGQGGAGSKSLHQIRVANSVPVIG